MTTGAEHTAAEPADSPVLLDRRGALAVLTLNRPSALNALNRPLTDRLQAALVEAREDPSVRAIMITGAGRGFCAGQDLAAAAGSGVPAQVVREVINPLTRLVADLPKPTLAAVNGVAAGAGMGLALACHLRIASDRARFVTAFSKIALTGDTGIGWTLPRLVGLGRATELLMLSEPVSAATALEWGLVSRVVPAGELDAAAEAIGQRLAAGPTLAYGAIARILAAGVTGTLDQTLEVEADEQAPLLGSADHAAAVQAFLAKRDPVYQGR